ncbi:MAG TPA: choice-of-anchor tandem repeat GloVer-containing protein [Terriglobales bacterium]|jgi:uncharacterized repeat protein (TIGR03803 family)|nr:choice-of-anchor tandem repeat GloVer-containing protein [Terriglobales bacterium]
MHSTGFNSPRKAYLTLVVLSALLLIAARTVQAQMETVLYNFTSSSYGSGSVSNLIADGAGNFYGTTAGGGQFGEGTVFELSPNGSGGWNESVLYSFTGGADGANPSGPVIFDSIGNLYGTTFYGGANGDGAVFELSPVGTNWTESVLHSFGGPGDAADNPVSGVILDQSGNLFGMTYYDVVFELSPSGGTWAEQVIYSGGNFSQAGLTMDSAGNIFGGSYKHTTSTGTVFELSPNGSGGWNSTAIHTFKNAAYPLGTPIFDKSGNLYGTTSGGGAYRGGTLYRLGPGKSGPWTLTILHAFGNGTDGGYPAAGIVFDAAGNIYGTTAFGGESGDGSVFELVASGKIIHTYKEKVLWSFTGADGSQPYTSLVLDNAGNSYGTTSSGGSDGHGNVYEVTP